MTVKELIQRLQAMPPQALVVATVDEGEHEALGHATEVHAAHDGGNVYRSAVRPDPTWGRAAWCDEDIGNELEEQDIEPTKELIEAVRDRCGHIADVMVEVGWEVIYEAIHEAMND